MSIRINGNDIAQIKIGNGPEIQSAHFNGAQIWPVAAGAWWNGGGAIPDANCLFHQEQIPLATPATIYRTAAQPWTVLAWNADYTDPAAGSGEYLWDAYAQDSGGGFNYQGIYYFRSGATSSKARLKWSQSGVEEQTMVSVGAALRKIFCVIRNDPAAGLSGEIRTIYRTNTITGKPALSLGWPGGYYVLFGSAASGATAALQNPVDFGAVYDTHLSNAQITAVFSELGGVS